MGDVTSARSDELGAGQVTDPPSGGRRVPVDVPDPVAALLWVCIALPFVFQAVRIWRASWDWLSMQTADDAFYYLEVARRIAAGEGSTFDGINRTNGYHPLWQGLTTLLASVFDDDRSLVITTLLMGLVLTAAALILFVREIARVWGRGPALAAGLVASSGFAVSRWTEGMEGPATLLALALLAIGLRRSEAEPGSFSRAGLVGITCGLLVMSRLDLVLVVWVVPLVVARSDRRAGRPVIGRAGGIAAGAAALLVPFGLWFLVTWGEVVTTSAAVKSSWMRQYSEDEFGGRLTLGYAGHIRDMALEYARDLLLVVADAVGEAVAGLLLVATAASGAFGIVTHRIRPEPRPAGATPGGTSVVVAGVLGVVVLKVLVDLVLLPPFAVGWYAAAAYLVFPLAVGGFGWFGAMWVLSVSRPAGVALIVVLATVAASTSAAGTATSGGTGPDVRDWLSLRDSAADWILAEGPAGRYGAFDAGLLGYRLHGTHELVNLDGLVNDYEFADLVDADTPLDELIAVEEIDFVVNRLNNERQAAIAGCSEVIWESPGSILAREGLDGQILDRPVVIVDVRGCREARE
jgi:hypothetical protein